MMGRITVCLRIPGAAWCARSERQLARARRAHPGTAHALRAHTRSRRPNSRKDSKGGQTRTWFVRLVLGSHGPNTIHMIDGYNPPRTELTEPQHPAEASNQPTPAARFCLCHPHTCNECPTVGEVIQAGSRQLSVDRRSTNARLLVKFAPADRSVSRVMRVESCIAVCCKTRDTRQ